MSRPRFHDSVLCTIWPKGDRARQWRWSPQRSGRWGLHAAGYSVIATAFMGTATAQTPPVSPVAAVQPAKNAPHLSGETIVLPFVLVKGYPFIKGAINGKKGKLLFDLGATAALVVNSHVIAPTGGVAIGRASFGSGQTYRKMRFPLIDTLVLPNRLSFRAMADIEGNTGLQLEQHITPDFIGWLGLDFFDGYLANIDYVRSTVTFHRNDPNGKGARAALAGESVVKTIAFGNPGHRNLSTVPITVGTMGMVGLFDTGSHNMAWLTNEQIAALERAGHLHSDGDGGYMVSGVRVDGLALPAMPLDVVRGNPPFAKYLPSSDVPSLVLGYEFLKLYTTVIDYDRSMMTLLKTGS